jgi:hypothetical protein
VAEELAWMWCQKRRAGGPPHSANGCPPRRPAPFWQLAGRWKAS